MQLTCYGVGWEYRAPFRTAYRTQTHAHTLRVELRTDDCVGRGEAIGISYYGETIDSLLDQMSSISSRLHDDITHVELELLLPPGGARNALDCALWDLRAKQLGRRAWEIAGLRTVRPLTTAYTLGLDTPEAMARAASAAANYPLLKLKLNGDCDLERVNAVRRARPTARLIVDANQAWTRNQLRELVPQFARCGVRLIEQPLPTSDDGFLTGFESAIPLCADESCQTAESLPSLIGKYDYVNLKLDKTGGLTAALRSMSAAQAMGFEIMVGCMGGSSLSMAPAFIIGQYCSYVDLDAPLLIKADVPHAIRYDGASMHVPAKELWG